MDCCTHPECSEQPAELAPELDKRDTDVVLIVDDVPENLSLLHDALEESGYTVLVATNGESALQRARQSLPDVVLLDAVMPGIDGFEVCRRLKADFSTQHIPVVFMTGLQESEHVVAGFAAGGTDYVPKPMRVNEVLARVATHLYSSRLTRQARNALDAFGQAVLAVTLNNRRLVWQTPLARTLMESYFPDSGLHLPVALDEWVESLVRAQGRGEPVTPLLMRQGAKRLIFSLFELNRDGELMLLLREESDAAQIDALTHTFALTQREAEVLYWLTKGKTNRDIGEILGTSPRTVNKHLEHVFVKLGVETRTAAAAMAMKHVRVLRPA